ncbi:hypothetical protein MMC31_007652 [Peltigera leucophlebia]|nr:hypothetical protein [Peltigera leucophlebia]
MKKDVQNVQKGVQSVEKDVKNVKKDVRDVKKDVKNVKTVDMNKDAKIVSEKMVAELVERVLKSVLDKNLN